jgi:hypothetical protein
MKQKYNVVIYLYDIHTEVKANSIEEAIAIAQKENKTILDLLEGEWQFGYVEDSLNNTIWEADNPNYKLNYELLEKITKKILK